MSVGFIFLLLGGIAVFGIFGGVSYYLMDRAGEEEQLQRLQYINSLIQGETKRKNRATKRNYRKPKNHPFMNTVRRVHKRP